MVSILVHGLIFINIKLFNRHGPVNAIESMELSRQNGEYKMYKSYKSYKSYTSYTSRIGYTGLLSGSFRGVSGLPVHAGEERVHVFVAAAR